MRYASLASGSKGNCHALCDGDRVLLIDAGVSLKQILLRLGSTGFEISRVQALAITHEHSDHISALPVILNRTAWPVMASAATKSAIEKIKSLEIPANRWIPLEAGKPCGWHGWRIHPFSTPHDAVDSVAFRIEADGVSLGIVTDLGQVTSLAVDYCQGLNLLALEANHDIQMLREGNYPPHLKARILSRVGHLSNGACAEMLSKVISPKLEAVVLSHLSQQNNDPELARFAAKEVLSGAEIALEIARQGEPLVQELTPKTVCISG